MQRRLFLGMTLYVALATVVFSMLGWVEAYSAFLGGAVALLAIGAAALTGLKLTARPGVAAYNLVRSEVVKFLIAGVAMALVFKLVHPIKEVVFLCVLFVGFLVVPLIGYRHVLAGQQGK